MQYSAWQGLFTIEVELVGWNIPHKKNNFFVKDSLEIQAPN